MTIEVKGSLAYFCAHDETYEDGISRWCDMCDQETAWFDARRESWRSGPHPEDARPTDDGWLAPEPGGSR